MCRTSISEDDIYIDDNDNIIFKEDLDKVKIDIVCPGSFGLGTPKPHYLLHIIGEVTPQPYPKPKFDLFSALDYEKRKCCCGAKKCNITHADWCDLYQR